MMGLRIGWFRCEACRTVKRASERAYRSPYERGFGVCQACYETWEHLGRRCPRCWAQVQAHQTLAFFTQWGRFGHFDCGGALLA
jgi:predicted amidophosphoribosyltransferase